VCCLNARAAGLMVDRKGIHSVADGYCCDVDLGTTALLLWRGPRDHSHTAVAWTQGPQPYCCGVDTGTTAILLLRGPRDHSHTAVTWT
jgi:hypothetical protein